MESVLILKQGDSDIFEDTISNMDTLSGYDAKMYIKDAAGTEILTITGSISGMVVSYVLTREASKAIAVGKYDFEAKVFDESHHNQTPSKGKLIIEPVLENDPS